jgi:hypothetical protein
VRLFQPARNEKNQFGAFLSENFGEDGLRLAQREEVAQRLLAECRRLREAPRWLIVDADE